MRIGGRTWIGAGLAVSLLFGCAAMAAAGQDDPANTPAARGVTQVLTAAALRRAIQRKRPSPGLTHHSDRGGQYCAHDYRTLVAHGLERDPALPPPTHRFLATGDAEAFASLARRFLGPEVASVEHASDLRR